MKKIYNLNAVRGGGIEDVGMFFGWLFRSLLLGLNIIDDETYNKLDDWGAESGLPR